MEHRAIWRPKRSNVACGKNRPVTRKKLICKCHLFVFIRKRQLNSINEFNIFDVFSWACGVIMFTLLVGCPPFWHRKQMVMLRNIMEGKYSFTSPEWADISGKQKKQKKKQSVEMFELKKNIY